MATKPPFVVPPTDAVIFLNGHDPQPANPWFFLTLKQANETRGSLLDKANKLGIPTTAKIIEDSAQLGPVMYGSDGRAVWALSWTEVDVVDGVDVQVQWQVQLGLLYWRWQELKYTTQPGVQAGHWHKTDGGSIVRY